MNVKATSDERVVASNRRARRDYEIVETIEAGIMLKGAEVKSLRESKVTLADTYARERDGQMWIIGLHVSPYSNASSQVVLDPDRDRKLLLHRDEIDQLANRTDTEHLVIIPLSLYFKGGRAKVELALARPKKQHDKRADIARRDADLEARRAMARANRRR